MKRLTAVQQLEVERLMPQAKAIALSFSEDDQVLSEAYLLLCQAVLEYDPSACRPHGGMEGWVTYYIQRRLVDMHRKDKKEAHGPYPPRTPSRTAPSVHEVVDALPADLKPFAQLRWVEGRTWAQIASDRNVSVAAAKFYTRRARDAARKFLNDEVYYAHPNYDSPRRHRPPQTSQIRGQDGPISRPPLRY